MLCGIVNANKTPAIVAWIPELWVKSQRNIPTMRYGKNLFTLNLFNIIKTTMAANINSK